MTSFTGVSASGEAIHYVDAKRPFWLLSLLFPLQPFVAAVLYVTMDSAWWVLLPFATTYVFLPLLDAVIGEDRNNPPEEVVMQLDRDRYYRILTFIVVPLHFVTLFGMVAFTVTHAMTVPVFVVLAALTGLTAGLAINTGHELGHKNSRVEKLLAKLVLAVPAYGHFTIEHNRGHHKNVATFKDPSSARMGESIYRFALREVPGAMANGWAIEKERLQNRGKSAWHTDNQILQSYATSVLIAIVLMLMFGWKALPFLAIHHVFAYWQLTSANYIEHYGLLRKRGDNGKVERCEPRHSWNSNHTLSNLILFHLQRHSDHHTHPLRRYQSLRNFADIPQLPSGYPGMYVLAYVPWLWFKVMNKRLMALPHVDGDLDKVNVDPPSHPSLFLQWSRDKMLEPTYTDLPGI